MDDLGVPLFFGNTHIPRGGSHGGSGRLFGSVSILMVFGSDEEITELYPRKINKSPENGTIFKRKIHLPTINFQGIC